MKQLRAKELNGNFYLLRVPFLVQVWDYNRSAEMRDTEGGASKRSVLEQAEKLKKYLESEGL